MVRVYSLRSPLAEPPMFLEVGDIVYLTGIVVTARDQIHKKIVVDGVPPPIDLRNMAVWHAGPVVKRTNNTWVVVSIGSTTSTRMESMEYEFIERTGVRMIIGKGFMGVRTAEACKRYGCIVALFPGGFGALGAKAVKRVLTVYWLEELGVPEAMWVLEVENLGPLVVTIDAHGRRYQVLEGTDSEI